MKKAVLALALLGAFSMAVFAQDAGQRTEGTVAPTASAPRHTTKHVKHVKHGKKHARKHHKRAKKSV
jgi:hypothetical protein